MSEKAKVPAIRFKGYTDAWEQRKFEELYEYASEGGTPDTNNQAYYYNGNIPFVKIEDTENKYIDSTNSAINSEGLKNSSAWMIPPNNVIFTNGATVGNVAINRIPVATKQGILGIIPQKIVSTEFMYYLLSSTDFQREVKSRMATGTFATIILKNLNEIPTSIPSSSREQERMSEYLSALDNLITLHQRKLEKLKNVKKAMLEKMFPKSGCNIPEIRFAGFTDAWERRKLGDIVTEVTRTDANSSAPIMMITANYGFIEQSERYAFNNAGESLKKYIQLEKGELAYNHGASKLRPYGSCFALTNAENARVPFVYHCFSAVEQNPEFLSIELNGLEVESQLRKIVSSGARMDGLLNISFKEYTSIWVKLPGKKEQDKIAAYFRQLDNLITLQQCKIEKFQNVKKAMLEKMFV